VLGGRLLVPGAPFDVALTAADIALVTRPHASSLSVLELDPPRVTHAIPVGATPSRVVPSLSGDFAYVTCQFVEAIDVVDLPRRQHTASIPVSGHPLGAILSADGQTLYVATNCDRLLAVSLSRHAVIGDIPIPYGSLQLRMHPSGRRLFVSCWRSGQIVEIELPTLRHLRTFEVGGAVQELVITADGQTMYAANEGGWLDVIHIPTGHRTATLKFGTFVMGLALSADEGDIVVSLLYAGRVLVIDRKSLTVRATLETGGKPRLIAAHPKGKVLVANEAGWVDFIL
jgi:DNA-binding beta-propeller fold protein YncE